MNSNPVTNKEQKKDALIRLYRVDDDEFTTSLRRVISVICLNEYFQFSYSKSLLEAKQKELEALKIDVERYRAWRPSSKKIKFPHLVETIDFVIANLK